jgi:hypothetical protein
MILENYKLLGYGPKGVFPIKFRADIEVSNGIAEGVLVVCKSWFDG